ncbi:MAG: hypothetical protein JW774_04895 [Candidatus Aureabacteria bacterium]|nr:hypothetical protein [Candidatus Auribacterota bacterium]
MMNPFFPILRASLITFVLLLFVFFFQGCGKKIDYGSEINAILSELNRSPQSEEWTKKAVNKFIEYKYHEEARDQIRRLRSLAYANFENYVYIGESYEKIHDFTSAKSHYESYISSKEFAPVRNFFIAQLHYRSGELDQALTFIQYSLNESKDSFFLKIEALNLEARIHQLRREDEACIETCNAILTLDDKNDEALIRLGNMAYRKSDFSSAMIHYNRILEKDPLHYEANYKMGLIHYFKNDIPQAQVYLGKAASQDSSLMNLMKLLEVKKFYDTHDAVNTALVKVSETYWWQNENALSCFTVAESMGLQKATDVRIYIQTYAEDGKMTDQIVEKSSPANLFPGQTYHFRRELPISQPVKDVSVTVSWNRGNASLSYE